MSRFFAMERVELENIVSLHNDLSKIKAEASRKEIGEITAILKSEIENMGDLFEVKDGVAHIPIIGELSEKPSMSAALFGQDQTTFGSIIDNIKLASEDPTVEKIIFEVDSPGGNVSGVDQTAMAIRAIKKPTEAHVHNMAASAAFWLAAQADKIVALTPTAEIGSIGVAVEIMDDSEQLKNEGLKIHTIVSVGAEKKRPDVSTKKGRDQIRDRLTAVHDIFVNRVAIGRKVSEEKVRSDFGHGGLLIASEALEAGMIDKVIDGGIVIKADNTVEMIAANNLKVQTPARGAGKNIEEVTMTTAEFIAENPALYTEILEAGIGKERDRVQAHLTMGKKAGAMDYAIKCITEGRDLTEQAVTAEYLSAGMNKNDLDARDSDDPPETPVPANQQDGGSKVFAEALAEELGIKEAV